MNDVEIDSDLTISPSEDTFDAALFDKTIQMVIDIDKPDDPTNLGIWEGVPVILKVLYCVLDAQGLDNAPTNDIYPRIGHNGKGATVGIRTTLNALYNFEDREQILKTHKTKARFVKDLNPLVNHLSRVIENYRESQGSDIDELTEPTTLDIEQVSNCIGWIEELRATVSNSIPTSEYEELEKEIEVEDKQIKQSDENLGRRNTLSGAITYSDFLQGGRFRDYPNFNQSGIYVFTYPHYFANPVELDSEWKASEMIAEIEDEYESTLQPRTWMKVGQTSNLVSRLSQHYENSRTTIPEEPKVLRWFPVPQEKLTDVESMFHDILASHGHYRNNRITGRRRDAGKEWFMTSLQAVDSIARSHGLIDQIKPEQYRKIYALEEDD